MRRGFGCYWLGVYEISGVIIRIYWNNSSNYFWGTIYVFEYFLIFIIIFYIRYNYTYFVVEKIWFFKDKFLVITYLINKFNI